MPMILRVSEFDVTDAIRQGDLSLGIIIAGLAMHSDAIPEMITRTAADYIRSYGNPDASRALLRDLLTHSERPLSERLPRAAG